MNLFRIILAGLVAIPAIIFLVSFTIGIFNAAAGAEIYGSQRAVASLFMCLFFSIAAFLIWPRKSRKTSISATDATNLSSNQSTKDLIVSTAASRMEVSNDNFDLTLTTELNHSPLEVMNLWDELGQEFGIELSAADYPDVNSIQELRNHLGS